MGQRACVVPFLVTGQLVRGAVFFGRYPGIFCRTAHTMKRTAQQKWQKIRKGQEAMKDLEEILKVVDDFVWGR